MKNIPRKVLTNSRVYSILIIVLRNKNTTYATVAQLVEYDLAKVGVAGSNPVCRFHNLIWKVLPLLCLKSTIGSTVMTIGTEIIIQAYWEIISVSISLLGATAYRFAFRSDCGDDILDI